MDKKQDKKIRIILASASPRRRELLRQAGVEFDVIVSHADENVPLATPALMVEDLARRKGLSVAEQISCETGIIIGADTIVVLDDQVLGKPGDEMDACVMLKSLSGRTHQVMTGVSLTGLIDGKIRNRMVFHEVTDVTMRPLTDDEIWAYIESGDPMDKAGAYGIQGMAGIFVSGICGDYYNVVGLPLCATVTRLREMKTMIMRDRYHNYEMK